MDPRNRAEEEMTRRPEPLTGDEQAEDLAPEDERLGDDEDDEDDTLGRPVQLDT
jgi:hypothetical protein